MKQSFIAQNVSTPKYLPCSLHV